MIYPDQSSRDVPKNIQNINQHPVLAKNALASSIQKLLTNSCTVLCTQPNFLRSFAERKGRISMGQRYVISVTKTEVKNEAGCYQNSTSSHFNLSAGQNLPPRAAYRNFKNCLCLLVGDIAI